MGANVFVFRCNGGRCACRRRAEVSVDAGAITVWIQGDGADTADFYGPQLLANDLADGELVVDNAAGYGSIEVTKRTATNLRNWLFHRGILLPEPEPEQCASSL